MAKRILVLVVVAAILGWVPTNALAHGASEITVTPDTIAPGGKITVKGEAMGENEEFEILLEGLKFKSELGKVRSDADEEFTAQFTIPATAPEGVYQVKAVGKDGDTVSTELTITQSIETTSQPVEQSMPSAEEHQIPRRRVSSEMIGLFAVALVSAGLGLVMVRWK